MISAKEAKEAFVTGHKGTSPSEILLVCCSAPIGIFLFHELRAAIFLRHNADSDKDKVNMFDGSEMLAMVFLESVTILLPMVICQSVLLYPFGVVLLVTNVLLGLILNIRRRETNGEENANEAAYRKDDGSRKQLDFLTFYRSTVYYLTYVAILAVDFNVFPRSFAKTEVYGYGLMDLGAGSFCISGGLVSRFAQRVKGIENTTQTDDKSHKQFMRVLVKCIPLIVMGLIRFIGTKGLEYQEHVSEYGVHWNFFFTLTFVATSSTFMRYSLRIKSALASWIPMLLCYQVALDGAFDLQRYIEDAPRDYVDGRFLSNAFAANREGICGCIGYLILHLASEDIAHYCLWSCPWNDNRIKGGRLYTTTILFWLLHWVSTSVFHIPASRRSTNASFILWTISHNMTILSLTCLAFSVGTYSRKIRMEEKQGSRKSNPKAEINPPIFSAVNRHGLIIFILANLMTGGVNLSMNTLEASHAEAIAVIFVYLCGIGAAALLLDFILVPRTKTKKG